MQFDWLVQKIYEHPDLSIGIFIIVSLFIAGLAFIQIIQAWKIFWSKKKLLKELRKQAPPSRVE